MQMKDFTTLQTIPGFRAILKAVITAQIQTLVEQLHLQTGEESLLLTASTTDGTICFLGSGTGQEFLKGREDIKSQFLTHCQNEIPCKQGTLSAQSCQRNMDTTQTINTEEFRTSSPVKPKHHVLHQNSMEQVFSIQSNGEQFPLTISNCTTPITIDSSSTQYCPFSQFGGVPHVDDFEHKGVPVVSLQTVYDNAQKGVPLENMQTIFGSEQKGAPILNMHAMYNNEPKGLPVVSVQTTYSSKQKQLPVASMQTLYDHEQKQGPVVSIQTMYNAERKGLPVASIQAIYNNDLKEAPSASMQTLLVDSHDNVIVNAEPETSELMDIDKQTMADLKDKTKKTLSSKIQEITERIKKDEPHKILEDALQLACISSPEIEVKAKGAVSKSEPKKPRQRKSGKTKDVSRASHRKPKLPRYNIGAASDEEEGSQTDGNSTMDILDIASGIDDSDSSFAQISLDELRDGVILKENETDIPLVGYTCINVDDTSKTVLHNVFNLKPDGDVINVINKSQEPPGDVSKVTVVSVSKERGEKKSYKPGSKKSLINKKLWLKCNSCPERFPNREILQKHMETVVHSLKKYTCDLCGWKFGQLRDKERHRRIHTGERPFKCDICNKDFARKDNLKLHRRKHSRHMKQLPAAGEANLTSVLA